MTEPVIRIVDDEPQLHDALAFVLENEGYAVRHYYSAEEFLAQDLVSDPGCAILDVRMGGMSGLVLHQEMRKRGIALPVIFLSAHGDIDMAVTAMEGGAVTFLTKPPKVEKLLDSVEKALKRSASAEPEEDVMAARAAFNALSARERQVALLAGEDFPNRQIAERLEIAVRTVEFHRAGAMRKLGCHDAAELKRKLIAAGALEEKK
ncbi:response regulator transcription factor [Sutterella sp.]|uniref:response regulator transcription factor n=1 Tax=Sutterella sp. TaxID=1981025 RepID=UPI0026E02CCB|nr:response regulator [Sutterella sp.]MDO5530585.1 response regulator [Sutterella sp.]